jgi:hypothetical protein
MAYGLKSTSPDIITTYYGVEDTITQQLGLTALFHKQMFDDTCQGDVTQLCGYVKAILGVGRMTLTA